MENLVIPVMKALLGEETRIAVFIPKEPELIKKVKQLPNAYWSYRNQCWHFPYMLDTWQMFKSLFSEITLNIQATTEPIVLSLRETTPYPTMPLKKEFEPNIVEKDAQTLDNIPAMTPQETAKHRFTPVNLSDLSAEKEEAPLIEKPALIENKIVVRFAHFWKGRIRLDFYYRPDWVERIKKMDNKRWHPEQQCWSLPHSPLTIDRLKNSFGDVLQFHLTPLQVNGTNTPFQNTQPQLNNTNSVSNNKKSNTLTPQYAEEITKLEEKMTLKRMAIDTIKLYKNCFAELLRHYNDMHPSDITKDQIIHYMLPRIKNNDMSEAHQNNFISAVKCYYEQVLGRERTYYDLQRPKKPFQLPNILSEEEIVKLINAVKNIKHKCILLAIYSGGLRVSELVNLRIKDLKREDNCMFIKGGKGKKDRLTLLSPALLTALDPYLTEYSPSYWLFEGQTGGCYSKRSVQNILRDAVDISGVNPFATVHTLRHSFATHLVLAGENLVTVQKLLGHEDIKTTEIYIHLTGEFIRNTKSPLDRLKF